MMTNDNHMDIFTLVKTIDSQLFELICNLICSICHELLDKPVTTPCGHTFCNDCIKRVLSSKNNSGCPLCKNLIKKYSLVNNKAKLTLSEICKELPGAFLKDVKQLESVLNDKTEDILKISKMTQLSMQEFPIKEKDMMQETSKNNENYKKHEEMLNGTDNDSFAPVLMRQNKVAEYSNTKKNKLNELKSVSQTEVFSTPAMSDIEELKSKLCNIENLPAEEKVKEWFKTVGDNIIWNDLPLSQSDDFAEPGNNNGNCESDAKLEVIKKRNKNEDLTSLVRRNCNEVNASKDSINKSKTELDPYEFIPSQNKFPGKKRKRSNSKRKALPDFEAIRHYSKETVKRNSLLDDPEKEREAYPEPSKIVTSNETIELTVSQKFDKLLAESKGSRTFQAHTLFQGSQLSSAQFLDCSGITPKETENPFTPKIKQKKESVSINSISKRFSNCTTIGLFTDCSSWNEKTKTRGRRSSIERRQNVEEKNSRRKKKSFIDLINLESQEALDLEKSMENYLKGFNVNGVCSESNRDGETEKIQREIKNSNVHTTKLMNLLEEIINDKVIYGSYPETSSVKLQDILDCGAGKSPQIEKLKEHSRGKLENTNKHCKGVDVTNPTNLEAPVCVNDVNQGTNLVGFCTQEELPEEIDFKKMVEKMESELKLSYWSLVQEIQANDSELKPTSEKPFDSEKKHEEEIDNKQEFLGNKADGNLVSFILMDKIKRHKRSFINFLQLGRITPSVKRSKTSVVKLVFPAGFSSFFKKRPLQKKCAIGVQTSQAQSPSKRSPSVPFNFYSDVSQPERYFLKSVGNQTSQIIQTSDTDQTCPKIFLSAEIQTCQRPTLSAAVQTTQVERASVEIQSSQIFKDCRSMEIQTSQSPLQGTKHLIEASVEKNGLTKNSFTPIINFNIGEEEAENKINSPGKNLESDFSHFNSFDLASPPKDPAQRKRLSASPLKANHSKHRKIIHEDTEQFCRGESADCFLEVKSKSKDVHGQDSSQADPVPDKILSALMSDFEEEYESHRGTPREIAKEQTPFGDHKFTQSLLDEHLKNSAGMGCSGKENSLNTCLDKNNEVANKCRVSLPTSKGKAISEPIDVIDLCTQNQSEHSEIQMIKLLNNLEFDLLRSDKGDTGKESESEPMGNYKDQKSEESDSDFFVEQTPPRPKYSRLDYSKHLNVRAQNTFSGSSSKPKDSHAEREASSIDPISHKPENSESFLILSAPLHNIPTPKKSLNDTIDLEENMFSEFQTKKQVQKEAEKPSDEELTSRTHEDSGPNENDQNQLNATRKGKPNGRDSEPAKPKAIIDLWKRSSSTVAKKPEVQPRKGIHIVASSVKKPETIRKFAQEFKLEYSSKPSKDMTHLIVGLHESDEGEELPLCTPKLLFAMANKRWVLSESWAEDSLKKKMILPEEGYETRDPVGGSGCRSARLSTDHPFNSCEICLLGTFENISKEELAGLIVDSGGALVTSPDNFSSSSKVRLIIADEDCLNMDEREIRDLYEKYRTVIVSRDIIIMSIQCYKLSNFSTYLLHDASLEDLRNYGYPLDLVKPEEKK